MQVDPAFHKGLIAKLGKLEEVRQPYLEFWKELADHYLPQRYSWLSTTSSRVRSMHNPHILDSTGAIAARVLASGMMNGITSPARPWFTMRLASVGGFEETLRTRQWLDEVTRRMAFVLAESNFYNAMAVMYLDLVVFGSAAMLIYEDYDSVIRCYNPALGEFYFAQDDRLAVSTFARKFTYTVEQVVSRWGEENVSRTTLNMWKKGGAATQNEVTIYHMLEPNMDGRGKISPRFKYRETYWEEGARQGQVLAVKGFNEMPGLFVRWSTACNDAYGFSPGMEAIGDVKQLQQETLRKAQGIDKMVNPPIIADSQLAHRPTATIPNGITYITGANSIGAKPLYQIAPPLGELSADIEIIQARIRETMHNPLFQMISQLDTVRSATEIDARREEKLVLLGPVLERFENEALDPAINRVYSIMQRAGLLPEPPEEIQDADIEIQYVSVLSTAQRAVAAIPTERFVQFLGNISPVQPQVLEVVNWDELVRNYARDLGVPSRNLNEPEVVQQRFAQQAEAQASEQAMAEAGVAVDAAQQLSATDVGGGANALQMLLGG